MRILLCLNRDFISNIAFNRLRPALQGHAFDVVLSRGIGKRSAPRASELEAWSRLEQRLIEHGLYPLLDARPSEGKFQSFDRLAQASRSRNIMEFDDINRAAGLDHVRTFNPDAIVSIRFGQIFRAPIIEIPRLGIVNLHSGILPDYRGILATFWALLNGEAEIGCTLHYVTDATIDTGPVIGVHRMRAARDKSLLWNIASLYDGGTALLADTLAKLSDGRAIATVAQDARSGRTYSYPEEEHVAQFLERGNRLYSKDDYAELFALYGVKLKAIGSEADL